MNLGFVKLFVKLYLPFDSRAWWGFGPRGIQKPSQAMKEMMDQMAGT